MRASECGRNVRIEDRDIYMYNKYTIRYLSEKSQIVHVMAQNAMLLFYVSKERQLCVNKSIKIKQRKDWYFGFLKKKNPIFYFQNINIDKRP